MSEWLECKLGDLISYKKGFAFKSSSYSKDGDFFIVRVSDTTDSSINIESCMKIKKHDATLLDEYKLLTNDIIIATVGSWADNPNSIVGKVIKVPAVANEALLNQNAVRLRNNDCTVQKFIYYRLINSDFSSYLLGNAQGSANQASITLKDIFLFQIKLPPLPEQKAIAAVLSSLDDKIDLLHRQNKTLEAMAETLFKQWFVVEAREDLEFVELGNYANCFNGVSYKSSDLNPSKVAMVTLKSFDRNGGFRLDGFKEYTGKYKEQHIVKQGDLVVAHTDITQDADVIGNPVLVVADSNYDELVISMDLVKVTSKYEWLSNEFLYRMMRTREFKQHCLGCSNGSTVLHLNKQAIPSYEFFLPPENRIREYTIQAKSVLEKKFKNISQIRTLETLRDNLLPKLMSGEMRVKW
jgi:type I restriction enzyme S subunit